jgi:hypothetical protein
MRKMAFFLLVFITGLLASVTVHAEAPLQVIKTSDTVQNIIQESTGTARFSFIIEPADYDSEIDIEIYDAQKEPVKSLSSAGLPAGRNELKWGAKDDNNKLIKDGAYSYDMYVFSKTEAEIRKIEGDFSVKLSTTVKLIEIKINLSRGYALIDARSVKLENIEILGNSRTSAKTIERLSGIEKRNFYTEAQLSKCVDRLSQFPFLKVIEYKLVPGKDEKSVVMRIKVNEEKLNDIKITGAYNPPLNGAVQGYLAGIMEFSSRNYYNDVWREVNLLVKRPYKERVYYNLLYKEAIDSMFFKIDYSDEREINLLEGASPYSYEKINLGLLLQFALSNRINCVIGYSVDMAAVTPNNISGLNGYTKDNLVIGVSFPEKIKTEASRSSWCEIDGNALLTAGNKRNGSSGKLVKFTGLLSLEMFPKSKVSLIAREKAGVVSADSLPYFELLRVGGINSIRGLDEDELACRDYSYTELEARLNYKENAFFYIFGGYSSLTAYLNVENKILNYGIGCRLSKNNLGIDIGAAANNRDSISAVRVQAGINYGF